MSQQRTRKRINHKSCDLICHSNQHNNCNKLNNVTTYNNVNNHINSKPTFFLFSSFLYALLIYFYSYDYDKSDKDHDSSHDRSLPAQRSQPQPMTATITTMITMVEGKPPGAFLFFMLYLFYFLATTVSLLPRPPRLPQSCYKLQLTSMFYFVFLIVNFY